MVRWTALLQRTIPPRPPTCQRHQRERLPINKTFERLSGFMTPDPPTRHGRSGSRTARTRQASDITPSGDGAPLIKKRTQLSFILTLLGDFRVGWSWEGSGFHLGSSSCVHIS